MVWSPLHPGKHWWLPGINKKQKSSPCFWQSYNMSTWSWSVWLWVFWQHFSNSLIIHEENTKEINVLWVFGNQMKNCSFLHPKFLLLKSFCLRSNIKHSTQCFITCWNTTKFVKNIPLHLVFLTLLSVFHLERKHCISCLI